MQAINPKISIIIPCYNMGAYLQETLDSVSSYPNKNDYEIIIVNDGSTDIPTLELLKKIVELFEFFILVSITLLLNSFYSKTFIIQKR